MNTTLLIDGGLGRVITAIPALEKFVKSNPNCNIVTYGWTAILFGNKIITNNIVDNSTKGLFNRIKDTKIIKPEPYYNSDYLNGKINLADAWNQEINGDNEKMPIPRLFFKKDELKKASAVKKTNHKKIIAFQPFGSTAVISDKDVQDNTYRSLGVNLVRGIVDGLRKNNYGIWLMTDKVIPFIQKNEVLDYFPTDTREMAAAISLCDYFLGIDSSGQHIARAFDKPGSIIMGGSNPTNVSYPDFFNILNDRPDRCYMPYRITEFDWWLSELQNDSVLDFNKKEIDDMVKNILSHIQKTTK